MLVDKSDERLQNKHRVIFPESQQKGKDNSQLINWTRQQWLEAVQSYIILLQTQRRYSRLSCFEKVWCPQI